MYSKDLELVVNRMKQELGRYESYIGLMYQGKKEYDEGFIEVAKEYASFANGTIKMIKEIDETLRKKGER